LQFDQELVDIANALPTNETVARATLESVRDQNKVFLNGAQWEGLGELQQRVSEITSRLRKNNTTIQGVVKNKDLGTTPQSRFASVLRNAANPNGSNIGQTLRRILNESEDDMLRLTTMSGRADDVSVRNIRRLRSDSEDAILLTDVFSRFQRAIGQETSRTGVGAAGGVTSIGLAGTAGAVIGGVPGVALGVVGGTAFSAIARPVSFSLRLANIENMFRKIGVKRAGFRGTFRTRLRIPNIRVDPVAASRLGASSSVFAGLEREEREETFLEVRGALLGLEASPELLMDRAGESGLALQDISPETSEMLAMQTIRTHQYLTQALPDVVIDPLRPEGRPLVLPSLTEQDVFIDKFDILDDPLGIYDRFLDGSLNQSHVEALSTVSPDLFNEMVLDVMEVVVQHDGPIPYEYSLRIGGLLGQDVDPTTTGEFLAAMMNSGSQTVAQDAASNAPLAPSRRSTAQPQSIETTFSAGQSLVR
jgi:hypothetical protein